MLRLDRPIVVFDLETTGTDINYDRIVQIAALKLACKDGGGYSKTIWSSYVNPDRPIPAEATAIHKITDAMVSDAPPFVDLADKLYDFLQGCDVSGYNVASFDVPFLSAEFKRVTVLWPTTDVRVIDTFLVFKLQEAHNLSNAYKFYTGKVLGDEAHSARADTIAATDVLLAQSERYGAETLEQMIALGRDPNWVDTTGKVKWVGDLVVINFGKWSGTPIDRVDKSYLRWILAQEFPADFRELCQVVLSGRELPKRST